MGRGRGPSSSGQQAKPKKKEREEISVEDNEHAKEVQQKLGYAQVPVELKKLRACMICSLIKSESEFEQEGCDNCEGFLQVAGTRGSVSSYTSGNFEGMISMMQPEESWVARWQRISHFKVGLYAVNVKGDVEKWVREEMEYAQIPMLSRDKSVPTMTAKGDKRKSKKRERGEVEGVQVIDCSGESQVGGAEATEEQGTASSLSQSPRTGGNRAAVISDDDEY